MSVETDRGDSTGESREMRRKARIAADWRPDPRMEGMRALLARDPAAFDQIYGPAHRIALGLYENAGRAAGAIAADTTPGDGA